MEKQKHHTSPHITALSLFHNDNNQIILHTHHNRPPLYFYTMHGLKLFGITALAANKGSIEKNLNGLKSVGTPLRPVDGVVSGRREALGAIFLGAAAFSSPSIANALDMDAFMNSEVRNLTFPKNLLDSTCMWF